MEEPPRKKMRYDSELIQEIEMNIDVDAADEAIDLLAWREEEMLPTANMTSSLTSLTSISTPASISFYTAKGSPSNGDVSIADVTNISTPDRDRPDPQYRNARRIPVDVKYQIQIHLEEGNYAATIRFLNGLATAGAASKAGVFAGKPAGIAPPKQLAFLANLAIHPSLTTRPAEQDSKRNAGDALQHLRHVLYTVGPVNANFRTAFQFLGGGRHTKHPSRGGRIDGALSDSDDSWGDSDEPSHLCPLAHEHSIWKRAPDFWSVVGWAFHCAAAYPHRWSYWRVWLDFMLDVLERDWAERLRQDEESKDQGYSMLQQSLFIDYLRSTTDETSRPLREVLRAMFAFADASPADKTIYKEVFSRETALPKESKKRKRTQTVDLEHENYADYLNFDSDDDVGNNLDGEGNQQGPSVKRPHRKGKKRNEEGPAAFHMTSALAETVPIRARLFSLLSVTCFHLPKAFPFELDELYGGFADTIRGLPLPMYAEFLSAARTCLKQVQYVSLVRHIVDELLPTHGIPDADKVDPEQASGFSQLTLEQCFLPWPAKSIFAEMNAKLALVLEHILRFIWINSTLVGSDSLLTAVEKGIQAREDKTRSRKRTAAAESVQDQAARKVMAQCDVNMRLIVDCLMMETGAEEDGAPSSDS